MGCDIHMYVERRDSADHPWRALDIEVPTPRSYTTFAALTGTVRNDHGVPSIVPAPRGWPEDAARPARSDNEDDYNHWYGDHSFSWLTLDEIFAFPWAERTFIEEGVLPLTDKGTFFAGTDRDCYAEWRKRWPRRAPKSWSRSVGGGGTFTVEPPDAERILAGDLSDIENIPDADSVRFGLASGRATRVATPDPAKCYVRIRWQTNLGERCSKFVSWCESLRELGDPSNTRLVFGFDS